jgi:DNA-binding LacI/PurR family transcriptional regulator
MQIVEVIKKKLASGKLAPGNVLPGEIELSKKFNVARPTLRKALDVLEKEGFIIRKKSTGTKIAPHSMHNKHLQADIACVNPADGDPKYSLDVLIYPCLTGAVMRDLSTKGHLLRMIPWDINKHHYTVEDIVLRKGIDGFAIFSPTVIPEFVEKVAQSRIPHIAFETHYNYPGVNTLMLDDTQAAYDCVSYLHKCGFHKIGFLGGALKKTEIMSAERRRFNGFMKACSDLDIKTHENWIKTFLPNASYSPPDYSFIGDAVNEMFSKKELPEAIVLSSLISAGQFLKVAKKRGIKIPDDVSVITISGSCSEKMISNIDEVKKLSGYFHSDNKVAQKGVDLLLKWLQDPTFRPKCNFMKFSFVEGNSIKK